MLNKDSLEQLRSLKQQLVTEKKQSQAQQQQLEAQRQKEIDARKVRANGVVKGAPGRFGFVTLEDGRDIYLPQEQMQRVFPDDQVAIEIITGDDGKPSAVIERLLKSPLKEFTGHYVVRENAHFVEPDLPRLSRWIFVPPKARGNAQAGDLVRALISRHPLSDGKPQARVEQVIGAPDSAFIAQRYALVRHQLPDGAPAFSEDDLEQPDWNSREDLSALPFVTIDGNDTLDMDDALCAERNAEGWTLRVAIADPCALIKAGSPLEQAIAERATSVYLPGKTIAMLPEALANERCSLQAGQDRLALVCKLELALDGEIKHYAFSEARIRSRARLTYEEASAQLGGGDSEWADSLQALAALSSALQDQRRRSHLLMPDLADYALALDANGQIGAITRQEKTEAHRLVEESMVAVNRCAADFLKNDRAVFVGHNGFRAERRDNVTRLIAEHLPRVQNADLGSLAGYVAVMQAAATAESPLPLRAILARSLERSQFRDAAAPHFGMGLSCYTTVTSPLRKYNDFLVHRVIKAKLRGETPPAIDTAQLALLQERNDQVRQASQLAQRWLECRYLQPQKETPLRASIRHINSSGLAIRLLDTGIEGFVDLRHTGEKFSFDQITMRLSSPSKQFLLEQEVEVVVTGVDVKKRNINLRLHSNDNTSSQ